MKINLQQNGHNDPVVFDVFNIEDFCSEIHKRINEQFGLFVVFADNDDHPATLLTPNISDLPRFFDNWEDDAETMFIQCFAPMDYEDALGYLSDYFEV